MKKMSLVLPLLLSVPLQANAITNIENLNKGTSCMVSLIKEDGLPKSIASNLIINYEVARVDRKNRNTQPATIVTTYSVAITYATSGMFVSDTIYGKGFSTTEEAVSAFKKLQNELKMCRDESK